MFGRMYVICISDERGGEIFTALNLCGLLAKYYVSTAEKFTKRIMLTFCSLPHLSETQITN